MNNYLKIEHNMKNNKKMYVTPQMEVVRIEERVSLLAGSYNGQVNAPEIDTFDDAEAFEAAGLGDIFGIPGFE
jgi:hypothetical protein